MTGRNKSSSSGIKLIFLIGIPLLLILSLIFILGKSQPQEVEQFPVEMLEEDEDLELVEDLQDEELGSEEGFSEEDEFTKKDEELEGVEEESSP